MSVDLSSGGELFRLKYDTSGLLVKAENELIVKRVVGSVQHFLWTDLKSIVENEAHSFQSNVEAFRGDSGNITFPMSIRSNKMLSEIMRFNVFSDITVQRNVNMSINSSTSAFDHEDIEPFDIDGVVVAMDIPANTPALLTGRRNAEYKLHLKKVNGLIKRHKIDEKESAWKTMSQCALSSHEVDYWKNESVPVLYKVEYDFEVNRLSLATASLLKDCTSSSSKFNNRGHFNQVDQWSIPEELESILIPGRESKVNYEGLY